MTQPIPINTRKPSLLSRVTKGILQRPIRVLLYGAEGCGKTTFASQAPNPIYMCAEDGTAQLDVARLPEPQDWSDIMAIFEALSNEPHDYQTLVIDTLDWLEPLIWREVCKRGKKSSIEDFGFGKGYIAAVDLWREFILQCIALSSKRNMHLIALGHSVVRRVEDPVTGTYDRHALKLHEKSAGLWRESMDCVLFCRVEVFLTTDSRTQKTRGSGSGSRVVHTSPTFGYDAKNRYDLPEQIPLDWHEFFQGTQKAAPDDPAKLRARLEELLPQLDEDRKGKLRKFLDSNPDARALAITLDKTITLTAVKGE